MAMPQLKLKCAGIENVMEGITGIENFVNIAFTFPSKC